MREAEAQHTWNETGKSMLRNSVTRPKLVASLPGQLGEELSRQGACQNIGIEPGLASPRVPHRR